MINQPTQGRIYIIQENKKITTDIYNYFTYFPFCYLKFDQSLDINVYIRNNWNFTLINKIFHGGTHTCRPRIKCKSNKIE